ncbi:MAG: hypothetical protein ACLUD2_11760 [Clostridium sp.]
MKSGPDEELPGFVRCRVFASVRRGNHAGRLAELLKDSGLSYSWTWISAKLGYDRYDEGMAVFSLSPIADTDQLQISRSSDYHYWKTRRRLASLRRQIRISGFTPFIWDGGMM